MSGTGRLREHRLKPHLVYLLILVPLPSIGLIFAMVWPVTRGTVFGQALYFTAKTLLLVIPMWAFWKQGRKFGSLLPLAKRAIIRGFLWGLCFAVTISIGIQAALWLGLNGDTIKNAAAANGLESLPRYIGLVLFLSFFNSLCEEFIWRDFLYRQWATMCATLPAVLLTNLSFTLHHTLALLNQTSWMPTVLGSLAVFGAGCIWSWLYLQNRSLLPGYISHILADLAIFTWGYWIIFGT